MAALHGPTVLVILDGWGDSDDIEGNAIRAASKPVWERLWNEHPHGHIRTSGPEVGLPSGQMGNSEVGHLNLGAGRVVYQEFTRIGRAIKTGSFFTNNTLTDAVDTALENDKALHILGLLSPGGVHSHEEHIQAMVRLAVERGLKKVYVHALLDGRDTPPRSALPSLQALEATFVELGGGRLASVIGRYYAMDRDHRWDRVEASYDLIALGESTFTAETPTQALEAAYSRGENDEFVQPTVIVPHGGAPVAMQDGDVMVFMNFRSDRAREITRAFIDEDFDGFTRRKRPKLAAFVSLTEYSEDFDVPVAFPPERLDNTLGKVLAERGLRQLRIAETEKYAHVTFFFNGGEETPNEGEDRLLIASPKVATYDQEPAMSAVEVTDKLVAAIRGGKYDAIICNYANLDMVGHTGNFPAAVEAVEVVDASLARVLEAIEETHGDLLVTADHGNAEQMSDSASGQAHTAHTSNPVPLVHAGHPSVFSENSGALCDVAPTMLHLMGLPQPEEMTGRPLVSLIDSESKAA
jgi:2,3-bisphosphoglycerate-independent phosphoglycerate mutase